LLRETAVKPAALHDGESAMPAPCVVVPLRVVSTSYVQIRVGSGEAMVLTTEKMVDRGRIELPTPGFSVVRTSSVHRTPWVPMCLDAES